jgi:hypothetical protein
MNERIRELADQCRTEYRDGHGGFIEQFDEEKFSELIVRECAKVGERYADGNYEVFNQILEHFGLEEE